MPTPMPTGVTKYNYTAKDCSVTVAYTQISCLTTAGTGAGYGLGVVVGGQRSAWIDANVSYSPPAIYDYTTEWPEDYGGWTQGGQYVIIQGSDFGSVEENSVDIVTFGKTGVEYSACNSREGVCGCRVVTDHTHINCSTVEWTGASHFFNVQINGQWSTSPLVSCGKPEVHNFTGNATTNADSRGGEVVVIHGANFGANTSTLDSVTYGPGGTEYAAKRCQYGDRPHRELRCEMVPGIGDGHAWIVTVDGQSSEASTVRTGYEQPTLTGGIVREDSPIALTSSTDGGQPYILNGTGFGLSVENTFIQVSSTISF